MKINKEELYQLYVIEKKGIPDIAKLYNSSTGSVWYQLDKNGIPRRSPSESKKMVYDSGKVVWNKGLNKNSSESVANISKNRSKYLKDNPEAMAKLIEKQVRFSTERWDAMTEQEKDDYIKNKAKFIKVGRNKPESKEKFSNSIKIAHKRNPDWAKKCGEINKKKFNEDTEFRERRLKVLDRGRVNGWSDPVKKEKRVKATLKGNQIRPTSIEQRIIDIIDKYKLPYKYVGNGQVIIDGKNPDFINTDGLKTIIELYGEYWHEPEDQSNRIEYFAKYGYKTLVIWGKDALKLKDDDLLKMINDFTGKCAKDLPLQIRLPQGV